MSAAVQQALDQALAASRQVTIEVEESGPTSASWIVSRVQREVVAVPLNEWVRLCQLISAEAGS